MEIETVQLHYFGINNNPLSIAVTGEIVDIGLPEGHTAVAHKFGEKWRVTHVQTGTSFCQNCRSKNHAVLTAKRKLLEFSKSENLCEMLEYRTIEYLNYLAKLWDEAAKND